VDGDERRRLVGARERGGEQDERDDPHARRSRMRKKRSNASGTVGRSRR
jgi:hypothetical protein